MCRLTRLCLRYITTSPNTATLVSLGRNWGRDFCCGRDLTTPSRCFASTIAVWSVWLGSRGSVKSRSLAPSRDSLGRRLRCCRLPRSLVPPRRSVTTTGVVVVWVKLLLGLRRPFARRFLKLCWSAPSRPQIAEMDWNYLITGWSLKKNQENY